MEVLAQAPGLFLGLIGWAATAKLLSESSITNIWQRAALIVFTWMLWMIPAFDIVVYHGLMPADMAVTYCGALTGALIFIVSITILARRSKRP